MYDLVVIGSPSFDWITHNSVRRASRTLAGPAFTTALTTSKLGIENMVFIGSISSEFETQFANEVNRYGIPERFTIESPETGGFEIECYDD
ncbi:MAG: hypothetical protein ACTSW8_04985, partial [Candidatus Thorarchaeota archaeon]